MGLQAKQKEKDKADLGEEYKGVLEWGQMSSHEK